jgi:hypothetical protein
VHNNDGIRRISVPGNGSAAFQERMDHSALAEPIRCAANPRSREFEVFVDYYVERHGDATNDILLPC